ncbi:endolysin [Streptomyces phage Dubu]|uniref:Lysin A, N-acetylmuramoyl-L-alanine amidase domain n=1 Tax=Streptomyces phage Dubu TaxID=2591226 RepID=A0A514DET7_9CAUD|nr:endolysin [Streptomyces phage Dubu]QDH92123.1 lysin A, N-acetylmuramoyl-L-alanine amidase domain [Streptomyces phage Dubu]
MATPMTPAQLLAQLRKWGVKYAEYRDWKTHNRNHKGAWGPVNGFMVHHTGSDSTDQRGLLYNGTAALPGPLCHFGLAQDGTAHLIGWGRANHAGAGDPDVLAAVQREDYGQRPPADNQSTVDGNSRFYGVEIWYSGSHKMTSAQYSALRKLSAAICDFHDWSAKSVIGHGEWGSPGKWDPGYAPGKMMDMAAVRADIAVTLAGQADKPQEPAPDKPTVPADKPVKYLAVSGFMPELRHGDRGWYVGWLQRNLNRFVSPNLKVTEVYDDATAKAVHAFYAKELKYTTTTGGRVFGADGWRRVLSIKSTQGGAD